MIDLSEELARLNANIERVMEENTTLQMQNVRLKAEIVALIAENGALGRASLAQANRIDELLGMLGKAQDRAFAAERALSDTASETSGPPKCVN